TLFFSNRDAMHTPAPPLALELAHVLFIDIVSYSTLSMEGQREALSSLQIAVTSTEEFKLASSEQKLIRLAAGDGMALVFFENPEMHVRCAVSLNGDLRHLSKIRVRMGIHSGPVYRVEDINANRVVAGGGVNYAQRVMDCGDAGHILLSSSVADVLK